MATSKLSATSVPESQEHGPVVAPSESVPGLMEKKHPFEPSQIHDPERIGGAPHENKEIEGWPLTPKDAAEIQSKEAAAGHDTGKGSLAARVQSAASYNVQEGVVPPVGTRSIGTERGVRMSGAGAEGELLHRQQQGGKKYGPQGLTY